MSSYRVTPWALVIGGAIGLFAAFQLIVEKIAVLEDTSYVPNCDINPVLSCGSVIVTEQASAFGFPNPILGLIGYTVVVTLGVVLLSGATLPTWIWRGLNIGAAAGMAFIVWLIIQSLYVIGALCPWCMVAWSVTIPIFWLVTADVAAAGRWSRGGVPGPLAQTVSALKWVRVGATYLVILALIFIRWMDFWLGAS